LCCCFCWSFLSVVVCFLFPSSYRFLLSLTTVSIVSGIFDRKRGWMYKFVGPSLSLSLSLSLHENE
jgi:hypothetical protein